jgi:hypothetical protein
MTDFVKISLSTDNVKWSQTPSIWNIVGLVKVSIVLGLIMVVEAFGLLYIGLHYFNLGVNSEALSTFSFEILFFFAMFSIFVVRVKGPFWDLAPGKFLFSIILADMLFAVALSTFGLLGLTAVPLFVTLSVIGYAFFFSLIVNDLIKVDLLERWHRNKDFEQII